MDESRRSISFKIEGSWSAEDMGGLLIAISDLYDLRLLLEILSDEWRFLDRYYDEFLHRFPFPSRRRRRFLSIGPVPWDFAASLPILDEPQLARVSRLLEPDERLQVRRVSYASPGSIDLVGIGAVVGHVKDFALKLIERSDSKRHRELGDDQMALENERRRIENARNFIALARDLGYTEIEIRRLVAHVDEKQEILARLVDNRKLLAVFEDGESGEAVK